MSLNLKQPIIYLITSGETTPDTNQNSVEFVRIISLVAAAVAARVSLIQLREKHLSAQTLYQLAARAAAITRGSRTRLLINDRADIARAACADGVHLTTRSLEAHVVRRAFPVDLLIGVSTHSLLEAHAARDGGAAFATFGPIFDTPSKHDYGPPVGLEKLNEAARALAPFPLIALGGITRENAHDALRAGASGVAAIRLFADADNINANVRAIRSE